MPNLSTSSRESREQRRSISQADPASEPITLAEAKKHLELAIGDETHDDHLTAIIQAAREVWERDTQWATTERAVTETFESIGYRLVLAIRPASAITSVTFDGTAQSSGTYSLKASSNTLELDNGWSGEDLDSVSVVYTAGSASVPEIVKHAIKLQVSMMFDNEKDYQHYERAYEAIVAKYQRPTYP